MRTFIAQVERGRLRLSSPVEMDDGAVVELIFGAEVLACCGPYLTDEARADLLTAVNEAGEFVGVEQTYSDAEFSARVCGRQLVLDVESSREDGTRAALVSVDEVLACGGDLLDGAEREELHAALDRAHADVEAGHYYTLEEVMAGLDFASGDETPPDL